MHEDRNFVPKLTIQMECSVDQQVLDAWDATVKNLAETHPHMEYRALDRYALFRFLCIVMSHGLEGMLRNLGEPSSPEDDHYYFQLLQKDGKDI